MFPHLSFPNSSVVMNNNKFLSSVRSSYFVVNKNFEINVAFIKNIISFKLVEEIQENLLYLFNNKNTIKSGILDNSMPFNYITADTSSEIGMYLQNAINVQLNAIINNLLTILSKTKNYLSTVNNNPFPTTVIN